VLINIVGNAIKFTQRGTVEVVIKKVTDSTGALKLAFVVKDSGIGITPEDAKRIFEPFTQVDASMTRRFGGSGLGLPLSKSLAQSLGGDVELTESIPGEGSTFTITIDPGQPPEMVTSIGHQEQGKSMGRPIGIAAEEIRLDGIKVLLVEDAPDNQVLVSHFMKSAGATVDLADNGQAGVRKALNDNFDILLMDLQMPIMNGYEAVTELRKQGYQKPILALTAHAQKEERLRCLASGFNDHIVKPIDRKTLIQHLLLNLRPPDGITPSPES
jgi:CheY-like chemotaxis protein/anti-sigma regulatory factor (Ser/Thr protein kinase)